MLWTEISRWLVSFHPSDWHVNRFVITLFRLLNRKDGEDRQSVIQSVLPHVLGMQGTMRKLTRKEAFADYPQDLAAAERALNDYRGKASPTPLLRWLRS